MTTQELILLYLNREGSAKLVEISLYRIHEASIVGIAKDHNDHEIRFTISILEYMTFIYNTLHSEAK